MKVLLDTHAFLWFIGDAPELSEYARDLIEDDDTDLLLSTASLWEMAIKYSIGKLQLPDTSQPFDEQIDEQLATNRIAILPVKPDHVYAITTLPHHHRDPFDRLIAAQALCENLPLVSIDAILDAYNINRLW
jgi:PIN domain nuclease of toxin-antitoxin system